MRRCLLVLDRDLATADEPKPGPVSYLAARQEEEPCEVVVLGLVRPRPGAATGLLDILPRLN